MTNRSFLVGANKVDITPPLEVGILMSAVEGKWAPFEGVRRPLHARALVIEQAGLRVALVSLDLLGLSGQAFGGKQRFKNRVVAAAQHAVKAADLIMAVTHSHSAPETVALTDLYQRPAYKAWTDFLVQQLGQAIQQAAASLQPCQMRVGTIQIPGLALYRRIKTVDGIVLSHPPPPPEKIISWEGPVDDSVNLVTFWDETGQPFALIVNATCHPVHEMCIPQISPDYPGEMSEALEQRHPGTVALFLNGAAGNINPLTVSGGPAEAEKHGKRLAAAINETLPHLPASRREGLSLKRRVIAFPARTLTGRPAAQPLRTEIAALRLGEVAFLFIPGEPFVEIGLAIREASPHQFTFIVGYAEDALGYIPTDQAFEEGGYELGPGSWAKVRPDSEAILKQEALELLREI